MQFEPDGGLLPVTVGHRAGIFFAVNGLIKRIRWLVIQGAYYLARRIFPGIRKPVGFPDAIDSEYRICVLPANVDDSGILAL